MIFKSSKEIKHFLKIHGHKTDRNNICVYCKDTIRFILDENDKVYLAYTNSWEGQIEMREFRDLNEILNLFLCKRLKCLL